VDDLIEELISNPGMLGAMCERVRQFAVDHCFEREFAKRTNALHDVLGELAHRGSRRGASKRAVLILHPDAKSELATLFGS
jgi:hypothetical protein